MALVLMLIGAVLDVPGGWGIEDFLGWMDHQTGGAANAMLGLWDLSQRTVAARAYLGLDSLLFVPFYSALLLTIALRLADAVAGDAAPTVLAGEHVCLWGLALPILALLLVDLGENAFGLYRIGWPGSQLVQPPAAVHDLDPISLPHASEPRLAPALLVTVLAALVLYKVQALRKVGSVLGMPWLAVGFVLALVVIFSFGKFADTCTKDDVVASLPWWPDRLGCGSHSGKQFLIKVIFFMLSAGAVIWLFGIRLGAAATQAQRSARDALRTAIWDMLARSRYVLIALAMMAVLSVGMDQGRDVVYAIASTPLRMGAIEGPQRPNNLLLLAGMLFALFACGIAVWLMVFSSWLWTRSVCQIQHVGTLPIQKGTSSRAEDLFAKQWARLLGFMPAFLVAVLCAGVIHDIMSAHGSGVAREWIVPTLVALLLGLTSVALGILFLWNRGAASETYYYNCLTWRDWGIQAGFWRNSSKKHGEATRAHKLHFFGKVTPYSLPLLLTLVMLLLRTIDALPPGIPDATDYVPSLSLAVILCAIALWLCFFGWLSIAEVSRSIPWVGILILIIGFLGAKGWTANHQVWPAIGPTGANPLGSLQMLLFSTFLAAVLLLGYWWAMTMMRQSATGQPNVRKRNGVQSLVRLTLPPLGLLGLVTLTLWGGDRWASNRQPLDKKHVAADPRQTLDVSLVNWLEALCQAKEKGDPCTSSSLVKADGTLPVYFVSTEGGGIRAAAWTALVLQRFAAQDPDFLRRTFSISGVSGGAVGAAVLRACTENGQIQKSCVLKFARTDLLTPLLSAWLFEDALARVLPTRWCDTPGCGFLSRGAWFEQVIEGGTAGMRRGLAESRAEGQHVPFLLLNATWVESGERAIASDLIIDSRQFRGAKDQLGITGHDLALDAAAHNAARFPYVNAIGALMATEEACRDRADERAPGAAMAAGTNQNASKPTKPLKTCGHLADGGYFDNSGAQSTIDVLHAFQRCLLVMPGDLDAKLYERCAKMDKGQRQWLRDRLVPQVLMVRNGAAPPPLQKDACPVFSNRPPDAAGIAGGSQASCPTDARDMSYRPERPICSRSTDLFMDFIGPGLAVLNVSGIGANGILAEARQVHAVQTLRMAIGHVRPSLPPVRVLNLVADGIRYPLGWHLSPLAIEGMEKQARRCAEVKSEELAVQGSVAPGGAVPSPPNAVQQERVAPIADPLVRSR
ncbi:hypothetical protein [Azohydromonas australica]|uniref:hypothetical protein n=1 Tax=Azohydromonas australica TaxID=364039 RepID=UPI0012EBB4B2|nr:hypothetical protein [Azohydromonas australica]